MAPVEQESILPVSMSGGHDSITWIFTLLCCTCALFSITAGDSLNNKQFRFLGDNVKIPASRIPDLNLIRTEADCLKCRFDGPHYGIIKKEPHINGRHDFRETSLKTLLLIEIWADMNRINGSKSRSYKNLLSRADLLNLSSMKTGSPITSSYQKRIVKPYDKKVFLYGKDDRLRIYPSLLRKFPYSNVVRLSTGCTGTLVTPQHVLTAAHCVHTGVDFRNNLEMLKVEVPDSMGVRAYYIEKIGIPGKWLHLESKHEHPSSWDYAIVKLSFSVHGRSHFFPLAVPTAGVLSENLLFLGFPSNKDDLWMSVCPSQFNKAMTDGNLILTKCDSAVGNSGAAVLSDDSREGKKIIGVLSSTMPVGRVPFYTQYSIITAFTWAKLYDICAEIGEIGVQHRVCPSLSAISKPRRFQISNNVIPFFG